ncbi:RNA methyltransferase [Limnohabitans sp. INBF002]|uniref:RNA methyltransferase n=1 Tax=Limnohabitans sp. INBF002 TaxID=2986280 RepID=UPI002377980F|nr:RNA methyltransferase [Limnohabitans sp. INBF002]BDU52521.1 tRNA (cytidine/uridine-2'-O-)-methyltransferase TrmJ [Limnohabitans sp. INBF002]
MKTRFILINTSHAGNVGATARAMKVMGFTDLVLVAPRWDNVLRREETIQRASGALDVLANARVVATLDEAIEGLHHLCATAMTPRDFGPPTLEPRPHFAALAAEHGQNADFGVGFLFGSERFGMRNEDVYRCHTCLSIPTDPKFGSLNLGAAVQVLAYDWRQALGGLATMLPSVDAASASASAPATQELTPLADAQQLAGLLDHWQQSLTDIGFLDPEAPKKLMPRLNQLFNRAQVTQEEIHILRGIAKAMSQASHKSADGQR